MSTVRLAIVGPGGPHRPGRKSAARGMSLVELMVGVAIGLFIVAAAATLISGQLQENRSLLIETQLQQDLRASADIIARELRRTGSWVESWRGVAVPGTPPDGNAVTTVTPAPDGTPVSELRFRYDRGAEGTGDGGFKLEGGAIKSLVKPALPWQELTDSSVMRVTEFTITGTAAPAQVLPCAKLCAGNTIDCWPRLDVRDFVIFIRAEARADPRIVRSIRSAVRVRNDAVLFNAPGTPAQACPV